MRQVEPEVLDALAQKQLKRRTFFSITARDYATNAPASAYFWNDLGYTTINVIDGMTGGIVQRTFAGSGTLITCTPIPLTSDLAPRKVTVTLNQVDDRIDGYVRGYDLKNAYCEIHRGLYNPVTHEIVRPPRPIFVGYADAAPIQSPVAGSPGSVTLDLVSHTRELTRAGYAVRSHADQTGRAPSDNILKYTGVMGSVQVFWGQNKVSGLGKDAFSPIQ